MTEPVVGVVSAGEMGSALGAALRHGGARVLTSTGGRSGRTTELARRAGLELVADLDEVVARSSVLLCVVPPQHAGAVVEDLVDRARRAGVRPVLAELDAVSPGTVAALAEVAAGAGLPFVDGAISGAPPGTGGAPTRLALAGPDAALVAGLPWTGVDVSVIGARIGAASAAKMCTGGVRKGLTALVIDALLTAAEHDVLEPVVAELQRALRRDPLVEVELAAAKSARFVPEMLAVADTLAGAGLDPALHRAVAAVYERTARSPLADRHPEDVDRDGERTAAGRAAVVAALRPAAGRGEA